MDAEKTDFCDCGHSLQDHAVRPNRPIGGCFVGGCVCPEYSSEEDLRAWATDPLPLRP
jgi:hypothetical protein